jgi:hypothetical protein
LKYSQQRAALRGLGPEAVTRDGAVRGVEFDADEATALELRCEKGRARAAERVENDIARPREALDQRRENAEGFLRRMQFVTGILPFEHVGNPLRRLRRIALREQIRVLVPILQKALG